MEVTGSTELPLSPAVPTCPQHLLGGEAELHRPALPRYVPSSEGGEKPPGSQRWLELGKRWLCPPFPPTVPGGWCPWSGWTACSQPCRGQTRTRSRACACPAPQHGGSPCPVEAGQAGDQHQREPCPSPSMCPGEMLPLGSCSPNRQVLPGLPRQAILSSWHSGWSLEPTGTVVSL